MIRVDEDAGLQPGQSPIIKELRIKTNPTVPIGPPPIT